MPLKIFTLLFGLIFIGLTVYFFIRSTEVSVLQAGDKLPLLTYHDTLNFLSVNNSNGREKVIVYFSLNCDNCVRLTEKLGSLTDGLLNKDIYMLTSDSSFFHKIKKNGNSAIKKMLKYPNVKAGIVSTEEFEKKFFTKLMPAIYVFGGDGILKRSMRGDMKLAKLKELLSTDK
jgi:hypothetical protein